MQSMWFQKKHELARKLLKSNKKESESQLQDNIQAEETGESSINQASLLNVIECQKLKQCKDQLQIIW